MRVEPASGQGGVTARRRLRVAHVTATFPPYLAGTGNVAYHNALELARRGHEVHVLTAGPAVSGADDPPGVVVHRLRPAFRVGNAPLLPGLPRCLRGFDLVHLHYPFYFGAEQVAWACLRRGIAYVVTYHQDVLFPWPLSLAVQIHHALWGRWVLGGARLVAATTLDYARNSRLARVPAHRLIELPNGVDSQRFRPDLEAGWLRARYQIPDRHRIALFVGALDRAHRFKGVEVLLRALARLPEVTLLLVGEGDLREEYQRQARVASLGARVRFPGRVPAEELPHHYAVADLVVLPSTTRGEAFGLVLIEAMATARPVVASRLPGVRAVVDDGVTGLLAKPGDVEDLAAKLERLLRDPERRARMGEAGRRKAEQRYDWRRIGERLEQVYESVLSQPRGAGLAPPPRAGRGGAANERAGG